MSPPPEMLRAPSLPTGPLRVLYAAPGWGHSGRQWADAIGSASEVAFVKGGRRSGVWDLTTTLVGRARGLIVKVERVGLPWRRVQARARRTRAWRQLDGYARLAMARLDAAEPVAILGGRTPDRRSVEVLVLERTPGGPLLRTLLYGAEPRARDTIARRLASTLAGLRRHRLWFRDFKPSNAIVGEGPEHRVTIIDTGDVRRDRLPFRLPPLAWPSDLAAPALDRATVDMLFHLAVEPVGLGCPPRAVDAVRLLRAMAGAWRARDRGRWKRWCRSAFDRVGERLRRHGDPTPREIPPEARGVRRLAGGARGVGEQGGGRVA